MTLFSANLGFLWTDLSLPDAIRQAKSHGFDAVECHWPYDIPVQNVNAALEETGLRMLGLNTAKGGDGMMGLSALPHTQDAARAAVDQAIAYGQAIDAHNVHVMAGFASGPVAHATFTDTLRYACDQAEQMTVLIEPLNRFDAPGYFLQSTDQAAQIIAELNLPNLKLMFDCYHVGRTEGDLVARLTTLMPIIGHIQFAGVPDRGTPLQGSVNYAEVFHHIADLGYSAPLGAEYHPNGATEDSLGWMAELRV